MICRLAVATWAEASVILAEKLNVPAEVGEPDSSPAEERGHSSRQSAGADVPGVRRGAACCGQHCEIERLLIRAEVSVDAVVISRGCELELGAAQC